MTTSQAVISSSHTKEAPLYVSSPCTPRVSHLQPTSRYDGLRLEETVEEDVQKALEGDATTTAVVPIRITTSALAAEYDLNEIAADQKYRDKILDVTGEISDFGVDVADTRYLVFPRNTGGSFNVQCSFSEKHTEVLSSVGARPSLYVAR